MNSLNLLSVATTWIAIYNYVNDAQTKRHPDKFIKLSVLPPKIGLYPVQPRRFLHIVHREIRSQHGCPCDEEMAMPWPGTGLRKAKEDHEHKTPTSGAGAANVC